MAGDKIKIEVMEMDLVFDNEPTMKLRTDSNSDDNANQVTNFKENIGYLGPLIKEHMRK